METGSTSVTAAERLALDATLCPKDLDCARLGRYREVATTQRVLSQSHPGLGRRSGPLARGGSMPVPTRLAYCEEGCPIPLARVFASLRSSHLLSRLVTSRRASVKHHLSES